MSFLRFYDGAKPGKKGKLTDDKKKEKAKEYESRRVERSFQSKWKNERDWLEYDEETKTMFCTCCRANSQFRSVSVKGNTFVEGSCNFRHSAIVDHEKSTPHEKALRMSKTTPLTPSELKTTEAGNALKMLQAAERNKLCYLFRNVHAIAKNNRPISDYKWLCELDIAKQIEIGSTYINDHAAVNFIHHIAKVELSHTEKQCKAVPFLSFLMDGTTDISGSEQETLYLRYSKTGNVTERFLNTSSPKSTTSADLYDHVIDVLKQTNIDKDKLVGMGTDGASNMTGSRTGLSTLMKQRINSELVNVHCLSHRLELAFRDAIKKNKQYEKLMTFLIGVHYFYKKSHKQKTGLLTAISTIGKGVLPPKVTGTRWLPHLFRSVTALLKTFQALEIHLATASHGNPKAEGCTGPSDEAFPQAPKI
ncbi:zinc finger protein 862-like isoform X2 [Dreissena polymorpha]|uniref:zinc finger protein 862-like isoform X3 n=3 Tax=Dreissena polymorpha TaxID=45954 RepID=UPI002264A930|nr:zinc finger protein 862-like isoform X3 [Dreissena polymorpha]XP_052224568.1 zinc finger protein 862-like isoform X2 [Dreissena polymorpha]XP_052240229.1 zinc finger protein 862-like isoform X2 [Dreissena polymorpha]XP_052241939.1 zinc finger protein 862-like isoform X2 [Dreissena polymorpha]XP_052255352.1 zinc finger protein 862-like isoform X3 [Dreissena polymorpha]XP_052283815.1 zinc finger protein 862-like isoform X2 [Dreissena polymorpha]XP_052284789.1 zinc finger protein 862-like iso